MVSIFTEYQDLIVVAIIMVIAMMAVSAVIRAYNNYGSGGHWKDRYADLKRRLSKIDSIFSAYPGLILVWDEKNVKTVEDWGQPRVYGSPAALASIQRFAEPGRPKDLALRILDGLADLSAIGENHNELNLRKHLENLRHKGEEFSISIVLPEGNVIEADGRVAGRQTVLWLEDASIRGEDERTAISRFETQRLLTQDDPAAFVDMLGRAPFPIWRMSAKGKLVWVNEAYIQAVGAEHMAEVLDNNIQLDKQTVEETQSVLDAQTTVENIRKVNIGSEMKSMRINLFPISGGVVGMAIDASETEGLRHALTRHVESHNELLNNMDEAIVIFGPDQIMSFHNTAFAELFKLEPDWFNSRPNHAQWLDLIREKQLLPLRSDYHEWKAAELALYTDWPDEVPDEIWSLPDGTTLRLARMRDPRGGVSMLLSDITNTVTLQGQFNTLINVQAATLDKLSEGIAVFGPDGRLKLSNKAFSKLWGLSAEDIEQGTDFSVLIEKCLRFYHDKIFWRDMKGRTTDPNPEVRLHVDGEIKRSDDKILTWLSRPLPDGATLIAWDDVTSARLAEAALIERAEALEAADRLKSEFVGHVSYQLRTPLTTISGYADFLQNNLAGELTDKQSEYVFAIQTASEDLKKTIDDILDIAAIEANVLDLELGDVDVFVLLEQALDYLATKAEDTKKVLTLDCPIDVGVIRADERRLKQVVYNLLSNALRFTKPGGNIILGARKAQGGGVTIWVKDDGVGISTERQPQVFESFGSSRGGAGLGLALVQRFVERHGGWVELESEEGKGTYVAFYMPREAATDNAHPEFEFKVAE